MKNDYKKGYEEWYNQSKRITLEQLPAFLDMLLNDSASTADSTPHKLAVGALATLSAMTSHRKGDITGSLMGYVLYYIMRGWLYSNSETGLRIIDYDKMLLPNWADYFEKTIPEHLWRNIQKKAKAEYERYEQYAKRHGADLIMDDDLRHLKSIIDGSVPFGFIVKN